jgi:BMFP domain-containing protein YqiC
MFDPQQLAVIAQLREEVAALDRRVKKLEDERDADRRALSGWR